MLQEDLRSDARDFATKKHKKQVRKFDNSPYVSHPLRVADLVKKYKNSKVIDELVAAAILHDTLEDTNTTFKTLERKFGKLVASLVQELTSDKEHMILAGGKEKYLAEKLKKMSSWALVIKLLDRLDNVSDFEIAPSKFIDKYTRETVYILNELEGHRKLSGTQQKIIKLIRQKLEKYL